MRLLLIQGDFVSVYDGRRRLAVFAGAQDLDRESAEQLRLVPAMTLLNTPVERKEHEPA